MKKRIAIGAAVATLLTATVAFAYGWEYEKALGHANEVAGWDNPNGLYSCSFGAAHGTGGPTTGECHRFSGSGAATYALGFSYGGSTGVVQMNMTGSSGGNATKHTYWCSSTQCSRCQNPAQWCLLDTQHY